MIIKAYAKINLTLDVLGKREDGYHEIESVMQTVSLFDELSVEKNDKIIVVSDLNEINNENNICYKTAREYFSYTCVNGGVKISIKKRIPTSAGLGGGSSDAAAVINALDTIYNTNLSLEDKFVIGKNVGADVPFLIIGGTADVSGIGEKVKPIKAIKNYGVVLLKEKEKESTGKMYSMLDSYKSNGNTENFVKSVNIGYPDFSLLSNDFLKVCDVKSSLDILTEYNPLGVNLSGSGPTVYAVYDNIDAAEKTALYLKKSGKNPIVCKMI